MGDSITVGQHLDPILCWTSVVVRRLGPLLDSRDVELVSLNRGVSGETTRMGLERFPAAVQRVRPDIMTLQYGLNDCNCWQTDEGLPRVSDRAFAANLVEMIARARHFGAAQIVLQTSHRTLRRTRLRSGEPYEDANARYSDIVREVAVETGATLCDIRSAFAPFTDDELERLLLPAPDHLHLSEEGNAVYADAILPYVQHAVDAVLEGKPDAEPARS
jgi:acyl-CoA thioesterase I